MNPETFLWGSAEALVALLPIEVAVLHKLYSKNSDLGRFLGHMERLWGRLRDDDMPYLINALKENFQEMIDKEKQIEAGCRARGIPYPRPRSP